MRTLYGCYDCGASHTEAGPLCNQTRRGVLRLVCLDREACWTRQMAEVFPPTDQFLRALGYAELPLFQTQAWP
jgi:hypothetical protein